ncbi:MAG: B12-binding domain-containing radical SAM protein [Magnetovibrionaceae bacterium]
MVRVSLADLTHTGQIVAANAFPLGISLIAAQTIKEFGQAVDCSLFKYPTDLAESLGEAQAQGTFPEVVGFSCFLWNAELSSRFAKRIKTIRPETVIVFGGANYPTDAAGQEAFLCDHPEIDFFIPLEGELPFVALLRMLIDVDMDVEVLKDSEPDLAGVHYLSGGRLIAPPPPERMKDLTETPSPYLLGLNDKFFDDSLIPIMETNRGCPFQCSFCVIGESYHTKVRKKSPDRIREELHYIAARAKVPDLFMSDSNFGMLKQDLETCDVLAQLRREQGWPKYLRNSSGKNRKEQVLEAARVLDGAMVLTVSVQSTSPDVLKNVRRDNISLEQIVDVGKQAEVLGANSYSEVILCLPGDTAKAHRESVLAMVDAEVNDVMMYQAMMLPGTDMATGESRRRFGAKTRYRVLPRCFGHYDLLGERLSVAETEEICVELNGLSFQDYLDCRAFNLSVELLYNGGIFKELLGLFQVLGLRRRDFVLAADRLARAPGSPLEPVFDAYLKENVEKLWPDRIALGAHLQEPGIIDQYIAGERGNGELYAAKAEVFFHRQESLHDLAFETARQCLRKAGHLSSVLETYLAELKDYSLAKKSRLNRVDDATETLFSFDFPALERALFRADPLQFHRPEGVTVEQAHTAHQRDLITAYLNQYGETINGLGRLLLRSHVNALYRQSRVVSAGALSGARAEEVAMGGRVAGTHAS